MEAAAESVELGVDGAGAARAVPVFVEFHRVAAQPANALARHTVRAGFTTYDPRTDTLISPPSERLRTPAKHSRGIVRRIWQQTTPIASTGGCMTSTSV